MPAKTHYYFNWLWNCCFAQAHIPKVKNTLREKPTVLWLQENQCAFLLSGHPRIQKVFEKTQCWEHPGKKERRKRKKAFCYGVLNLKMAHCSHGCFCSSVLLGESTQKCIAVDFKSLVCYFIQHLLYITYLFSIIFLFPT